MLCSDEEKKTFLDHLFTFCDNNVPQNGNAEEKLLKILVGTQRTTRLGAYPSKSTLQEIAHRINFCISTNRPLNVSCAWGAIKTVRTPNRTVDLAEMLALKQYQSIGEKVKAIYKPGLIFNIYLGDSYYEYLYGEDSRIDDYCSGMENLARGIPSIQIIRLKDKCKGITNAEQECAVNYSLLKEYWDETNGIPVEQFSSMPSSSRLHNHGWVGDISPAMREFYLKRMALLYPEEGYDYWADKVVRFFSYGLFISQHDLMGRKSYETSTVDSCLLRVPPPDLPRALYSNRIRMRIAPERLLKHSAPPWTVAGCVSIQPGGEMHTCILSPSEYSSLATDYEIYNYHGINVLFYNKR